MTGDKLPHYSHDIVDDENPSLHDSLRRHELARRIAKIIRGAQNKDPSHHRHPRVIGIYGSWGAGKSYLLSLVINELFKGNRPDAEPVIICPFKPWEYEAEGNLAVGLIKAMREIDTAFPGRNPPVSEWGRPSEFKQIATSLIRLIAQVLTNSGDLRLEIAGGIARTAAQHLIEEDDVKQIQLVMRKLIAAIQKAGRRRGQKGIPQLVVIIDDLDRCSPKSMVSMFEWLKVHLNVEGVTYVIALDHVAAAKAIVGSYGEYLGKERDIAYGYRYLEKLVDQEYELEETSLVEHMAISDVYGAHVASSRYTDIKAIAREAANGDFPGIDYLEQLIGLRSLRVPRTMLKIVWRFAEAMHAIETSSSGFRGRLPASYPFWILFLICVNYRLDPETLGDFVDGRSELYHLLAARSPNSPSETQGDIGSRRNARIAPDSNWQSSPRIEFWQFSELIRQGGGESLLLPDKLILQQLATIIRELIAERTDHFVLA